MKARIEITDDTVACYQDDRPVYSSSIVNFFRGHQRLAEWRPQKETFPEGLRFLWHRGDATVAVLEEQPAIRTVRWIDDDSPEPYGPQAHYRSVRLAFPFVVLVIGFIGGELSGKQQCFYRRSSLESLDDTLLLPNLYNCANAYGQESWLCLHGMRQELVCGSWIRKLKRISAHLFGSAFNRSSEVHEKNSLFATMRSVDPRVASMQAWAAASEQDALFPLRVEWRPAQHTLGQLMEAMIGDLAQNYQPKSVIDLFTIFQFQRLLGARSWYAK